jgi:hypothetical protein
MTWGRWIAGGLAVAALLVAACASDAPGVDEACSPTEDVGLHCIDDGAYMCVCAERNDDGECLGSEGRWVADPYCSCDAAGGVVCE